MEEFNFKLSNGQTVKIINNAGTDWGYEIRTEDGQILGTVFTDGDDGTDDEILKPFERELLQAIYVHNRPEL